MSPPQRPSNDRPEHLWLDDDVSALEDGPADPAASLVSLGFITAALRRGKWFWRVAAVIGLLVGAGLYVKGPHPYQASTTLLLNVGAEAQPGTAILDDQAIAQSHAVAGLTLRTLGLNESVDSFLASYSVTPLTDRLLQITASAPSSSEAVRRANALAAEFLAFNAYQLGLEQQAEFTALDQQIAQEKQHISSAPPSSSSRGAKPSANSDLAALEQQVSVAKAAIRSNTATLIGGSKVLDVASPVPPHSRKKRLLLYVGGGFIVGLMLAMIIIVLRAVLSDRLRRRDDVAQALGATVTSVPAQGVGRWLSGRSGRVPGPHLERITACLRDAVPAGSGSAAALALIPVDDLQVAAMSVVSLAVSCAQQGTRVVVADLSAGARAAVLLGAGGPGVGTVTVDGARLVTVVPDPAEFAPIGPLGATSSRAGRAVADELAVAWASADLLLTLITLDPSVGGEHLATWAADAVVVVTAGRSSWTKIYAVGEMIRLSGTRLVSAVLVGSDKTDESLGATPGPQAVGRRAVHAYAAAGSFAGDPGGGSSGTNELRRWQADPPEHVGRRRRTGG